MNTTPMDTFAGLDGCMEQHPTGSRKCPATGDLKELPPADFRESCEYYENDCREDMKKAILCTENGLSLSLFVTSTGSVTELCSVTADHAEQGNTDIMTRQR